MSTVLRTLLPAVLAALLVAGCGEDRAEHGGAAGERGHDDAAQSDDGSRAGGDGGGTGDGQHGDSDGTRGSSDGQHPGADQLPPIQVLAPPTFSSVHRSFVLRGTAQVHEGELRWSILDADLEPLATGRMTATCGAPCRGGFSTRVDVSKVPVGSWELHVYAPPVADDDPPRMHDVILPITVVAKPVDQPAADAPPPGGVPADL